MTDEQLLGVFYMYMKYLGTVQKHEAYAKIYAMCVKARQFVVWGSRDKAMRWLGFIQGVLWLRRGFTLDELKEHNMEGGVAVADNYKGRTREEWLAKIKADHPDVEFTCRKCACNYGTRTFCQVFSIIIGDHRDEQVWIEQAENCISFVPDGVKRSTVERPDLDQHYESYA